MKQSTLKSYFSFIIKDYYDDLKDFQKKYPGEPHKIPPIIEGIEAAMAALRTSARADDALVSREQLWPLIDYCYNSKDDILRPDSRALSYLAHIKSGLGKEFCEHTTQAIASLASMRMLTKENMMPLLQYPEYAENIARAFSTLQEDFQQDPRLVDQQKITDALKEHILYPYYRKTGLLWLMKKGDFEGCKYLLDLKGYKLSINERGDCDGQTALHHAVCKGNIELVNDLLKKGANVLLRDCEWQSAHDCAMRNGHEEITALLETAAEKVLLGEGGTPTEAECLHYKDSGLLKLLNDAKTDRLESFAGIKFLLKQGAGYDLEINKKGSYRNITALHEAAARGFWPLVKVFVERGADVTLKDYKQRTALDFAKQFNNKKMVQFLEEAARKAASQKQAQAQAEAGHPGGGTPEQQAGTPLPEERVAAEMERAAKAEARVAAAERRAEAAEQKLAAAERAEPAKVMEQAAGAAGRPGMSTLFLVVKGKAQDQADQKKAELNQLPESELSGPRL